MTAVDKPAKPIAPWWHTILVLLLVWIGSAVSAHQHTLMHVDVPGISVRLSGYLTVLVEEWSIVLLIWLALRHRGFSIAELISGRWRNARDFLKDLGLSIGFLLVAVPVMALLFRLLGATDAAQSGFTPKTTLEAVVWVVAAATAGFCEELIFRGYLMQQLSAWTRSRVLAVLLQGIIFGLAHGYYAKSVMVVIMVHGSLLGLLASWRKSLWPGMLAHGLQDSLGGLVAFFFVK